MVPKTLVSNRKCLWSLDLMIHQTLQNKTNLNKENKQTISQMVSDLLGLNSILGILIIMIICLV